MVWCAIGLSILMLFVSLRGWRLFERITSLEWLIIGIIIIRLIALASPGISQIINGHPLTNSGEEKNERL